MASLRSCSRHCSRRSSSASARLSAWIGELPDRALRVNDYILGQPEPPRTRLGARFAVFAMVIVIVVGLLTTRLFYLQVVSGGYYAGLAQDALSTTQPLEAARGLIYDRAGRPVAI